MGFLSKYKHADLYANYVPGKEEPGKLVRIALSPREG
jgi:hypothetical protein